ncbi:MAG: aconitase X catalytic domain-containing protein [Desulfurococcaceae archaeon TW002]
MYLTREEEAILNGELGYPYALAMKVLTTVGDSLGAEKLIPVVHAHVSGISYFNIGDAGLEFIESLATSNARFQVFTTANPYAVIIDSSYGSLPEDVRSKQLKIINYLRSMGARAFTCAPYYVRRPSYGEHLAWAESNAVLFTNSLIGAWSNREGGPLALLEGLLGKTYAAGVHLREGRKPKCLVTIKTGESSSFLHLSLIGLKIGELCPDLIPFVEGLEEVPEEGVRAFLASFGSTSNAPMVVFNKLTPDNQELLENSDIKEKFSISLSDLRDILLDFKEVKEYGGILYFIGCPHLSPREFAYLLRRLRDMGKRGSGMGELWLGVSDTVSLDEEITDYLSRMNVRVVKGMCPVTTKLSLVGIKYVVTDSGKALHYMPKLAGVKVIIKNREEILREFLKGESSEDIRGT